MHSIGDLLTERQRSSALHSMLDAKEQSARAGEQAQSQMKRQGSLRVIENQFESQLSARSSNHQTLVSARSRFALQPDNSYSQAVLPTLPVKGMQERRYLEEEESEDPLYAHSKHLPTIRQSSQPIIDLLSNEDPQDRKSTSQLEQLRQIILIRTKHQKMQLQRKLLHSTKQSIGHPLLQN